MVFCEGFEVRRVGGQSGGVLFTADSRPNYSLRVHIVSGQSLDHRPLHDVVASYMYVAYVGRDEQLTMT